MSALFTALLYSLVLTNPFETQYEKGMRYYHIAWEADQQNQLDKALGHYLKAHYHLMQSECLSEIVNVKNDIGTVFRLAGNPKLAIKFYDEALVLAKDNNRKTRLLYNKARAFKDMGLYTEALELLQICYKNTSETNIRKANIINEMGLVFIHIERHDLATEKFHSLINGARSLGKDSTKYLGRAYHNIADSYFKAGKLKEAKKSFQKAIAYKRVHKDKWYALSIVNLGETLYHLGKYREAIRLFEEANTLIDPENLEFWQLNVPKFAARCYDSLGYMSVAKRYRLVYENGVNAYNSTVLDLNMEEQQLRSALIYHEFLEEIKREAERRSIYGMAILTILISCFSIYFIYKRLKRRNRENLLDIQRKINLIYLQ